MAMDFIKIKKGLLDKYSISPNDVICAENISPKDKENIIYYLLSCYELARKNLLKGNLTASSYACAIILEDDSVYFGVNFNNTRNEISSICAERMAILETFNAKVKEYDTENKQPLSYKIKYILMSSYTKEGKYWADKMTPCADCLSWFNTGANLSIDTKICFLKKDNKGRLCIDAQALDNYLPLRDLVYETHKKISNDIKIKRSKHATLSAQPDSKLIELYNAVLKAYQNNCLAKTSNQNVAAGAIINGEIFTGVKVDFSKRWFIEPLMAACYKGIEKYKEKAFVDAVCFIGEEYTMTESNKKVKDGIVSLKTLGRLNTKFATNKTLVVTGSKEGLNAYTIADYMPGEHKFIHTYEIK